MSDMSSQRWWGWNIKCDKWDPSCHLWLAWSKCAIFQLKLYVNMLLFIRVLNYVAYMPVKVIKYSHELTSLQMFRRFSQICCSAAIKLLHWQGQPSCEHVPGMVCIFENHSFNFELTQCLVSGIFFRHKKLFPLCSALPNHAFLVALVVVQCL